MRRALILAAPLALALVACHGRAREGEAGKATPVEPRRGPALAVLDISGGLPEVSEPGLMGFGPKKPTFDDALRALEKAKKDKDAPGVLVRFGMTSVGMARAQELGEALESVKKEKPVYCHGDAFGNGTLYAAARGCTKIFVSPAGEVSANGLAVQMIYLHKLLAEELHVDIDFLQVGKFKGAEEPLTRDGPSPEARDSLESVLADMRESWLDGLGKGRPKPGAREAAEDGPFSPQRAKEKGLIDEVGYFDDARDQEKTATGAVRESMRFGGGKTDEPDDLGDLVRALSGDEGGQAPVALVRASGEISMRPGGGLTGSSSGITEKELGRIVTKLTKDDKVKAVVLRIDSPGGSALASDLLWHGLMALRAKKPIVVSVGDMAASGGYYLASTGNVIYADPGSIVGSIGVVGGKIGIGDALERFGVHSETFPAKRGDVHAANRAAYESLLVKWDDDTRARVFDSMTAVYDLFLARVAEGRKLPVDKIAASAEGRIFSGRQGKDRGLVDELGGLDAAIARARELAKLPADAPVDVVEGRPKLLEALGDDPDAQSRAPFGAASGPLDLAMRFAPELVPFVAGLAPLGDGEKVLAAMPYALVFR